MTGAAPSFWETLYANKEFYENHFARSGLISSDGTIEEAAKDIAKQHANEFRNEISDRTITSLIEYNAGLPEKKICLISKTWLKFFSFSLWQRSKEFQQSFAQSLCMNRYFSSTGISYAGNSK